MDFQSLLASASDPATLTSMLHAKSKPVDFKSLPPLHTIQLATNNELQMDVINIPSVIMQMAYNQVYISLSLLTTSALDHIRSNINLRYRKIPFGNGVGKQCLDESFFLSEDTRAIALFLQAYQN